MTHFIATAGNVDETELGNIVLVEVPEALKTDSTRILQVEGGYIATSDENLDGEFVGRLGEWFE